MKKKTIGYVWVFVLLLCTHVMAATHYVDLSSSSPTPPYTNWATAATSIQVAVNVSVSNDTVVVTNGHYYLASEILVTNHITIRSVNGPTETIVDGNGVVRCFNLGNYQTTLSGLTITNGYLSSGLGGGIYCSGRNPVATNCIIIGNSSESAGGMCRGIAYNCTIASNSAHTSQFGGLYESAAYNCAIIGNSAASTGGAAGFSWPLVNCIISGNSGSTGGGLYWCFGVTNCTISNNFAVYDGGGAKDSQLISCTIIHNIAGDEGGGSRDGDIKNCTIVGNSSFDGGGVGGSGYEIIGSIVYYNTNNLGVADDITGSGIIEYSCSPDVTHGSSGNITNMPLFVDALIGNYRLQSNSPCIDAGVSIAGLTSDIEGTPRPLDGNNDAVALPDIGAYEFTSSVVDTDGDQFSDNDEYVADTGIIDSNDWFRISSISNSMIHFQSSDRRQYTLLHRTNLTEGVWGSMPSQTGIMGSGGNDSLPISPTNFADFYRLEVSLP